MTGELYGDIMTRGHYVPPCVRRMLPTRPSFERLRESTRSLIHNRALGADLTSGMADPRGPTTPICESARAENLIAARRASSIILCPF